MLNVVRIKLVCMGLALATVSGAASADLVLDPGFQSNNMAAPPLNGYAYNATNAGAGVPTATLLGGWLYSGSSGVAANDSAFNVSGAFGSGPPGTNEVGQAGFLQDSSSQISQMFTDNLKGTSAVVSFYYEGRPSYDEGNDTYTEPNKILVTLTDVTRDNRIVLSKSITPTASQTTNFWNAAYIVPVTNGDMYTLAFHGENTNTAPQNGMPGMDYASFIDNVSVSAVPLPAAALAGLILMGGLAAFRHVRRPRRLARERLVPSF